MCLLDYCDCIQNTNTYEEKWSYSNQEKWKSYQNYYSTIRSPINIERNKVIKSCEKKIKINYNDNIEGILTNKDLTPYFLPKTTDNFVDFMGKKYILSNYHIHCSSENTLDNLYYPTEVHFVNIYTNPDTLEKEYIVISIMLFISEKVGLSIVNLDYDKIKNEGDKIDIFVNLKFLNDLTVNSYYNFLGTLTVPPFYQNFNWNLFDSQDVHNISLTIQKNDFNNLIYYFSNNKANELSPYNETRYIKDINNYSVIKKIQN